MSETIGRPVRVSSFSFYGKPIDEIANLVDEEGAKGTDIIVLPESWPDSEVHDLNAPPITRMAELAKKHNTYVVSPIYRKDGDSVYNTAVLLDRQGQVAFMYDKAYPCYEWDQFPNLKPGKDAPVYKADFGVIGFAICFDTNFPIVFDSMAAQGAELILWPSAYSAGTTLQSHALVNHFYIVSSTLGNDCLVFDINGEKILDESTPGVNITRITLDLDRGIYHSNWNTEQKEKLLAEHPDDVMEERWMPRESWSILKAKRPGVSARALAREYGLEELRDYKKRSLNTVDQRRGFKLPQVD